MSTITQEQQAAIVAVLAGMDNLPIGIGTAENACSIAAINLAISGRITDEVPDCMSEVIGRWIIKIQDSMPAELRNSARWRSLLPLAAGTGREHEKERASIALAWMWGTVLPRLQPHADKRGFGDEWLAMTTQKTAAAAAAAAAASYAFSASSAANAASYAADAATVSYASNASDLWGMIDPCGCLERMINVTKESP
jgi:hypothetical protein